MQILQLHFCGEESTHFLFSAKQQLPHAGSVFHPQRKQQAHTSQQRCGDQDVTYSVLFFFCIEKFPIDGCVIKDKIQ